MCFTGPDPKITSFCPLAGKKNHEKHNGLCPRSTRSLYGRSIRVSHGGFFPFIIQRKDGVDGCDIRIMKILCRKFNCTMNFKLVRTVPEVDQSVIKTICCHTVRIELQTKKIVIYLLSCLSIIKSC
jgi:hypothetical protein